MLGYWLAQRAHHLPLVYLPWHSSPGPSCRRGTCDRGRCRWRSPGSKEDPGEHGPAERVRHRSPHLRRFCIRCSRSSPTGIDLRGQSPDSRAPDIGGHPASCRGLVGSAGPSASCSRAWTHLVVHLGLLAWGLSWLTSRPSVSLAGIGFTVSLLITELAFGYGSDTTSMAGRLPCSPQKRHRRGTGHRRTSPAGSRLPDDVRRRRTR